LAVLEAFLVEPTHERYGLELSQAAGLKTGTIQPILARLEKLGWAESRWEELDPREAGRPRRRYYWLTPKGAQMARDVTRHSTTEGSFLPGLAGGHCD
jgi:DNA-binding PadR family transcriptional regulator